jgi:integrase
VAARGSRLAARGSRLAARGSRLAARGSAKKSPTMNSEIVSDRVGHLNMQVTLQIYTHRSTGRDRDAAERLGELIKPSVDSAERR